MEPNTLIYALNEFEVTYRKIILIIDTIWFLSNHIYVRICDSTCEKGPIP